MQTLLCLKLSTIVDVFLKFVFIKESSDFGVLRGWKRNNWISLIHYSIHFFSELFFIPYSVLLDIHYSVIYSFAETV